MDDYVIINLVINLALFFAYGDNYLINTQAFRSRCSAAPLFIWW
ncbi:hypothetical protein PTUN_a2900 [Pseudoalteromonas tunicata]|nr:hypothetical protein PTUN_a2900 [Pseudoalteromonas tunicata]